MIRLCIGVLSLLPSVAAAQGSYGLNNPVAFASITKLFAAVLQIVITVLTPVVIVFLIVAGFKYVTARGNSEKISEANKALLYGVIGGVIIIGAVAILAIITNLVAEFE